MESGQSNLQAQVLAALAEVREPGGKNLVDGRILVGIRGDANRLILIFQNAGWPEPVRERIGREVIAAIGQNVPVVGKVEIEWGTNAGDGTNAPPIRSVIAVGSGKGGVGKSTVAACLAFALRARGHAVGLMDADVYGPSIPHLLGLEGRPVVTNNRYQPLESGGIQVISMGFLVPPNQAVIWRGPMLHKVVRDFLYSVDWKPLDFLIVDLPPGTGDVVLSLSQQMPLAGGVIVCTPQDVALLDARKALHMFQTVKIPCLGIVENMSFFACPKCGSRTDIFGHGGARQWASEMALPFLGEIPIQLPIRLQGDAGKLSELVAHDAPSRDLLLGIADRLVEQVPSPTEPPAIEIT